MACDTNKVEAIASETVQDNPTNEMKTQEKKNMSSSLVLQKAPSFKMDAYNAKKFL